MEQLKQMMMAAFAVFGRLFAFGALAAQGAGGNFRRVFGALCLSAILGIGNAAFAEGIGHAAGERIDIADAQEFNKRDTRGWARIHYAARDNKRQAVILLLKRGADVNLRTTKEKDTPLHIAARAGNSNIVGDLIKAKADLNAKNKNGKTPFHVALENGHKKAAHSLVRAGVDASYYTSAKVGGYARTHLHFAAKHNSPNFVKGLVGLGANLEEQDNDGFTPLHVAALHNSAEAANALGNLGANVDARTKKGDRPIDLAQRHGRGSTIVKVLQEHEGRQRQKEHDEWVKHCRNSIDWRYLPGLVNLICR